MIQIDLEDIIEENGYLKNYSSKLKTILIKLLKKILLINEINKLIFLSGDKKNLDFIDEIFSSLDFSYKISKKDIENIPSEGKLIIVANHPLGALDALSILKAIGEIRTDVKAIANDMLINIENIKDLIIPTNTFNSSLGRLSYSQIEEALNNEEAVLFFPAAEVSRLSWLKIMDKKWQKGAIHFSKRCGANILPVYIEAKNSLLFYLISSVVKKASTLLLPREVFNKRGKIITLHIDAPIPYKAFSTSYINIKQQIKLLKRHTYGLKRGKKGIFKTEKNIIHPVNTKLIKKELVNSTVLGRTSDNKIIYVVSYSEAENTIKEVARLRELTFRRIGEGTGNKLDLDKFDRLYQHLILWDDDNLEIVGSYRFGYCSKIVSDSGYNSLYTSTLFCYSTEFIEKYLPCSIELGRSFIQKKYWNSASLDYLWQGIGLVIAQNPDIKYLFGGVSLSNALHVDAKNSIVYFYKKYFSNDLNLARSNNSLTFSEKTESELNILFSSDNLKGNLQILKKYLKNYGHSIPPLYKHYTDLCDDDGASFLDFGVDPDFENCIDGLILIEISKIKVAKRNRYIKGSNNQNVADI